MILLLTKDMAVPGSVFETVTSDLTLFVRNVRSKAGSHRPKKSITLSLSPKAVGTIKVILWHFVNPVTQELLSKAVTGGGVQISKTLKSGQRRGVTRKKMSVQRGY